MMHAGGGGAGGGVGEGGGGDGEGGEGEGDGGGGFGEAGGGGGEVSFWMMSASFAGSTTVVTLSRSVCVVFVAFGSSSVALATELGSCPVTVHETRGAGDELMSMGCAQDKPFSECW